MLDFYGTLKELNGKYYDSAWTVSGEKLDEIARQGVEIRIQINGCDYDFLPTEVLKNLFK